MVSRKQYYTEFGIAAFEEYAADGFTCGDEGEDPKFLMRVRHCPDGSPSDDKAKRGVDRVSPCNEECNYCDCWCNGDPDDDAPSRDALFDTFDGAPDDMTVSISGVTWCPDSEFPGANPMTWACFSEAGINSTWTLPWIGKDAPGAYCEWGDTWLVENGGGPCGTVVINAKVYHGAAKDGQFVVSVALLGYPIIAGSETPNCDAGTESYSESVDFADCGLAFLPGVTVYGSMQTTLSWATADMQAGALTAVFSGAWEPCAGGSHEIVIQAIIDEVKDPSGIVLAPYNNDIWSNCYHPVRATMGSKAEGSITLTGLPLDGDTIKIEAGGSNIGTVFEFDHDGLVGQSLIGADWIVNTPVTIGADAVETMANLVIVLNQTPDFGILAIASTPPDNYCIVRNEWNRVANEAIATSGDHFVVTGMSGGVANTDHDGLYWTATVRAKANGANTDWTVKVFLASLKHPASDPFIAGNKWNCAHISLLCNIFDSEGTNAQYTCNNIPGSNNDLTCVGGDEAEGGSVTLTMG